MIEKRNEQISVEAMCEVLDVSPSGYYASRHRDMSAREASDMKLGQEVERVFLDSRRIYGSDRVEKQLRDDGICTSRKRVAA